MKGTMKTALCHLKGTTPYSQSRPIQVDKLPKESAKDFEERTWRERLHVDERGEVYIPPTALKNGLAEAAKYLSIQIPGKGKATYTKHFEAGVLVADPIPLGVKRDDVPGEWLFVPSDGIKGSGKRVWKCFPRIDSWEASVPVYILDPTITESVFAQHIEEMGKFIGIGRFRPRNGGFYGRFAVESIDWK